MLSCEEALELMSQALDGPLPLAKRQALEAHLADCPACRGDYEALLQIEGALKDVGETRAPAELSARVMAQVRTQSRRPVPLWRKNRWRSFAGLAACAVLCLGLYYGSGLGGGKNVASEPAASQSAGGEEIAPAARGLSQAPEDTQTAGQAAEGSSEDEAQKADAAAAPAQTPEENLGTEQRSVPDQEASLPAAAPQSPGEPARAGGQDSAGEAQSGQTQPPESTAAGESAPAEEGDAPAVNAALAAPPWGSGTALVLSDLPQQARALFQEEDWVTEADGTRWRTVTEEELADIQSALAQLGVEAPLPERPWSEPCVLVLLSGETPVPGPEQAPE